MKPSKEQIQEWHNKGLNIPKQIYNYTCMRCETYSQFLSDEGLCHNCSKEVKKMEYDKIQNLIK